MPEESVQSFIFILARKLKNDAEKSFINSNITLFQYVVLKSIEEGCFTQNDIARKLAIKAPSLVAIIDSLEKEGSIQRHDDTEDRRRVILSLTKHAKELLKKTPKPSSPAFKKALESLGEHKKQQLLRLLKELTDNLKHE